MLAHKFLQIQDEKNKAIKLEESQLMNISGAEALIKELVFQGVDVVFGYPGGAILKIYDELYKDENLKHILAKHEQGAIHAAQGYARATGKVGVVFTTSGPGATNIVTGIADAMADATSILCITGQVAKTKIGSDAFQEVDIIGITRPITKYSYLIKDAKEIQSSVKEAFKIAQEGRRGPVLIDIPLDIQNQEMRYQYEQDNKDLDNRLKKVYQVGYPDIVKKEEKNEAIKKDKVKEIVRMMKQAKSPIFYCGGGVNASLGANNELKKLVRETGFPITLTLMGLGAFDPEEEQFVGMLGMYGTYEANLAMYNSDLIIAIGVRFDDRVTASLEGFAPNAKIVHIDIDEYNINRVVQVDISILGDAKEVIEEIYNKYCEDKLPRSDLSQWRDLISKWRDKKCLDYDKEDSSYIKPQSVMLELNNALRGEDFIITTDVGLHQMWSALYIDYNKPCQFITSGGIGTMGFGLPAALGAKIAFPKKQVICISGDGSILMNIQELATLKDYGVAVKILVLNNSNLGMVRQWQDMFYENRRSQTEFSSGVDLVKVANAFGIESQRATNYEELKINVVEFIKSKESFLLDVSVCNQENILPFIPPGASHNEVILRSDINKSKKKNGN